VGSKYTKLHAARKRCGEQHVSSVNDREQTSARASGQMWVCTAERLHVCVNVS
jgi:hypothetical protein